LLNVLLQIANKFGLSKKKKKKNFRNLQENHMWMILNGIHQLLLYVDALNLLGYNINAIKRNTKVLTDPR
jgi:hypothetical protein